MQTNKIQLGTGALRSPEDPRDWTLAAAGASQVYPDTVKLDTDWMKATMQGKRGCCVGCTGEETLRQIVYLTTGQQLQPGTEDELSFRFPYAVCKALEGTVQPDGSDYRMFKKVGLDEGTYGALLAKVLRKYGIPKAKFCPNDVNLTPEQFTYQGKLENIPKEAFIDALQRRSGADMVPTHGNTIEGIKEALTYAKQNNGAVMILRHIGVSYWQDLNGNYTWDKNKILPIRAIPNPPYGHCEFLTEYRTEPETGRLQIKWLNHWSDNWADKGRAWEYADEWLPFFIEMRVIVPAIPTVDDFRYTFKNILVKGMKGADVVALQHVLKIEKCFPADQAFTGNYGDITANAVKKLQEKYAQEILVPAGLTQGTGKVGEKTLAWLNKNYAKIN